jgi:hypothetical protein
VGDLIPSDDDIQIINKLDNRFTGARLAKIRAQIAKGDDMFGPGRSLHRIAHRLKTYPTGNRGKGRWYVFLKRLLSPANRGDILGYLKGSVNDQDCIGIRFWARFQAGMTSDYDVEFVQEADDGLGKHWVRITLLCDHEISPGEPGEPAAPGPDAGEMPPLHPHEAKAKKKPGNKRKHVKTKKSAKRKK